MNFSLEQVKVVPIAATDPTLVNRIEELEIRISTVSSTYSDEFDALSCGKVQPPKTP